ncbi:MAG TPA: hypothetical protein ACFCUD_07580 [Cyclobacteriaceae bacterium]
MRQIFTLTLCLYTFISLAQQNNKKLFINGYIKNMATFNFSESDSLLMENLIHHRLNFKWYPTPNLTGKLELRNRIIFGDFAKNVPNYKALIDVNNDHFDLSYIPAENNPVIHLMVDRAYLQWIKGDWEIKAGRQRINWGVNLVWNPNDIFNSYSFFDFDYEERPGSDAVSITRYTGFASSIELAGTMADNFNETVIAGKWNLNHWGYDFQVMAGKMERSGIFGAGWAGNISGAGFKGEVSWFMDSKSSQFLSSITFDYSFVNSLYLNGSILYNSNGANQLSSNSLFDISLGSLDVRSLSPYQWNTFLQTSYQFHTLITGGVSAIFYPGDQGLFINPNLSYSVITNLDLDLIGQFFWGDDLFGAYGSLAKVLFLRMKWSY